jgi:imidazolonepropionase-like amidohydrolase
MNTRRSLALICGATMLAGCALHPAAEADLYYGFTLVNPDNRTETPSSWLVVREGKIARIGKGTPPSGEYRQRHDMAGLYALPGLIDAHAHLVAGPYVIRTANGAVTLDIAAADKYSRFNAAIALAFGITTVRNPGGSTEAAARYDAMRASGDWIGPQALHAGRVIEPPPMSGQSIAYPKSRAEWDAEAARQKAAGMTYFKLYHDLTEAELAEGVRAATAHGVIPIAHLEAVSWAKAAELGVRQIEHTLPISADLLAPEQRTKYKPNTPPSYGYFQWFELADLDGPLVRGMVRTLLDKDVVVTPTLLGQDVVSHADDLTAIFPPQELQYYQPESFASAKANYDALAKLWKPQDFAAARADWPKILAFVKRLHDSGVKLMIGTDGTGGGPVYARELRDMAMSGIPAWDVLRMATSGNADLMGLAATGRIAAGKEADLVFLRADPVTDVGNVRQVATVVSDGKAYAFSELVALSARFAK